MRLNQIIFLWCSEHLRYSFWNSLPVDWEWAHHARIRLIFICLINWYADFSWSTRSFLYILINLMQFYSQYPSNYLCISIDLGYCRLFLAIILFLTRFEVRAGFDFGILLEDLHLDLSIIFVRCAPVETTPNILFFTKSWYLSLIILCWTQILN